LSSYSLAWFAAWLSVAPPESPAPASDPPRSAAYADVLAPLPEDQRDEAAAKRWMDSAKTAFRDERFEEAIEFLAEAYRTYPYVTLLYSLGSAHRRAYELDGNVEHRRLSIRRYQQYLSEAPDGESSSLAQNYLTSLLAERDLGSIEAEVVTRILVSTSVEAATMSIDGATPLPAPGVISVEPGTHELHVSAPGYAEFVQRVDVPEGATYQIDAAMIGLDGSLVIEGPKRAWVRLDGNVIGRLPLAGPLRASPGPHVVVVSKPGHDSLSVDIELERDGWRSVRAPLDLSNQRIASYFLFGLGSAGLVAAGVQFGFALDREARAAELDQRRRDAQLSTVDYDRYLEYVEQRNTMRTGAIMTGVGGGVLLLTAVVLFVYDNPRLTAGPNVARRWSPTIGLGQAGAVLRF
jgi:tetratricopeptide (TPR) repeat protein